MNSKHNTKTPAEKRTNQATTSTNVVAPSLHASAATDSTAASTSTSAATATTANANTETASTSTAVTGASENDAFEEMPEEELLYELADLFKALSDTTRIRILCLLLGREFCVADIEHALGVSQSAVSHQVSLL